MTADRPTHDLLIVGLGPAGATLARLLDPGRLRVLAVDAKPPAGMGKACGGLLSPNAQKAMARFALGLPSGLLADPQLFSVEAVDLPSGRRREYHRFYVNFDRTRFDDWLVSRIPPAVETLRAARCSSLIRIAGGFRAVLREASGSRVVTARNVVGADGSRSLVRRLFFRQPIRRYVCLQQWFARTEIPPRFTAYFDERITDAYGWGNVKDRHWILGAALPPDHVRERFERFKQTVAGEGPALGTPTRTEAAWVSRPRSLREIALSCDGAFLVGEAAGWVSPSSLEGISYAMESAAALADAFNRSTSPETAYRFATAALRRRIVSKWLKNPFLYQPALRRLVLRSGLGALH